VALPYADLVARHGLTASHWFILEAIPPGSRVLDIGCASGYLAAALRDQGSRTVGIEPDPGMAQEAEQHCERVIATQLEQAMDDLAGEHFDAIVLGDVLEHLADPWTTLTWARERLAPGGVALVSVPNIAHWSARWSLARGRFDYADYGIFDRTHLRFFTQRTAHELAQSAGFEVEGERWTPAPLPGEAIARRIIGGTPEQPRFPFGHLRWFLSRKLPRLFALQFVMTLRPAVDPLARQGLGPAARDESEPGTRDVAPR
jgi:methionine biosynthesis protein MetW